MGGSVELAQLARLESCRRSQFLVS
jgi:hypothetical protein